jgi:hypothetical protein
VNNKHLFTRNLAVYNHDTRSTKNFHLPITNLTFNLLTTTRVALPSNASKWQMGFNSAYKGLTIHQKGAYYTGIKIFNYPPTDVKNVTNEIPVFKRP